MRCGGIVRCICLPENEVPGITPAKNVSRIFFGTY
mgnify:CR=1 FL=1